MTIIESIAVAFHYPNIHLFYKEIYDITWYGVFFLFPGLIYLRYKKIIKFITLKKLVMTLVLASVISGWLYHDWGWDWIDPFYILLMYATIVHTEKEIQKEEQQRQNASNELADQPKKEKRKLSRTTKALLIISIITSLISVILNYYRLINLN